MRLSNFITQETNLIANNFQAFAKTHLMGAVNLNQKELRDHIMELLIFIARNMSEKQTPEEQEVKSKGDDASPKGTSVAQLHGDQRLNIGLSITDLAKEYRALRANILKDWMAQQDEADEQDFYDMIRFNEAIDEVQIEALIRFHSRMQEIEKADEQKNEFIAVLGHELRNPLAAISGAVEVIKIKPEILDEMLGILEKSVRRISFLLDETLDLSRINRGEIKLITTTLDLSKIIEGAAHNVAAEIQNKNQSLILNLPEQPLWVNADIIRIEQVIINLLTNAHKYTQHGGAISLHACHKADKVVMTIQDNGIGIPPNKLTDIFKPFMRIKQCFGAPGGLGIGLTLVKKIILQHGGEVQAYSQGQNKGAKFTITLPKMRDTNVRAVLANHKDTLIKLPKKLKVLIVDDEPNAVIGIKAFLEKNGCIINYVETGPQALKIVPLFKPDIFLIDIGLPDMSGFDLSFALRELGYHKELIIAISGYGHDAAHEMSKKAGIDYHLNKPVDYKILSKLISQS